MYLENINIIETNSCENRSVSEEITVARKLWVIAKNIARTKSSKKITCKISIPLSLHKQIYKDYQESSILSTYETDLINAKKKKEKSAFTPKCVYIDHKNFFEFIDIYFKEGITERKNL